MRAKVLFKIANTFLLQDLDTNQQIKAVIRKKTKLNQKMTILIGDNVEYVKDKYEFVIEKIIDRKNSLIRPKVANVNTICIVYSVKEPDYNSFLLNKFLAFYEARNIDNVIIYFSKMDLLNEKELLTLSEIINEYKKNNYFVFTSDKKEEAKNGILNLISDNVICFVGQSGAGKSTLINYLIPELKLKTQEISQSLNRGKHTTTSSFVFPYNDGFIIDTPGFSSIDLGMNQIELANAFTDFRLNNVNCKFKDCLHNNEIGCYIKELVKSNKIYSQRYLDYLKMLSEIPKVKQY